MINGVDKIHIGRDLSLNAPISPAINTFILPKLLSDRYTLKRNMMSCFCVQKMMKSIGFKIFITVFILIALHVAPEGSQSDRYIDSVKALVDNGNFSLQGDAGHIDSVRINGNLYSVIAPGLPIILAPLYYIHQAVMTAIGIPSGKISTAAFNLVANIFVMAPLIGVTAVAMFHTLRTLTSDIQKQLWLVFIFVFGSLTFFYSIYGIWVHAYTMSLIFIAFSLIVAKKNNFVIGLIIGLAQLIDYIAVLPIFLLLGFWAYTNRKSKPIDLIKKLSLLLVGYAIFLTGLMYYNYLITGSALQTPNSIYLQQAVQEGRSTLKSMFILPSIASLWGLSFSPFRGIFLYFPMMFLFVWALIRNRWDRDNIMLFSFLFFGFTFLFNSTYYAWSGDSCFGPRHLVTAMPFVILPIVNCQLKYIKIFGIISIFINLAGVSTVPSNNVFTNIAIFLYRGLFLHWLDWIHKIILPRYFNVNLSSVTPFFIYVVIAYGIYLIWKPITTNFNDQELKIKDESIA